MRRHYGWYILALLLALIAALAGCWRQAHAQDCATARTDEGEFSVCYATYTPTEEPTWTPTPISTADATPTAALPAATATITATSAPPMSTSTPQATPTPTSTETATATATRTPPATNTPAAVGPVRIAILGDSFYDEYQGTDNRGGAYHAWTFNGTELMQRLGRFDLGAWGNWGGGRRTGYEYNWAVSGAQSNSIGGQANSAAPQFRAGLVDYAFIGIGANDFSPYSGSYYADIYNGTLAGAALQTKIDTAVQNVTTAVDVLKAAGAQGVAVTLFTDWNLDPIVQRNYPDATKRARVGNAIAAVNAGLRSMAVSRGVYVVDQNAFGNTLLPKLDSQGRLNVGGELITFVANGDEPHYAKLADGQHIGTVVSGITANYYFVDALRSFGLNIAPLTDAEILQAAGLRPAGGTPTWTVTPVSATPTSAPGTTTPTATSTATPRPTSSAVPSPTATPTPTASPTPSASATAGAMVNAPLLNVQAGDPSLDANNRAIVWAGDISPAGGYTQVRLVGRADGLSIYAQQMVPQLTGGQFAIAVNGRNYPVASQNTPGWTLANRCGTDGACRGWNALRVIPWAELGGRPAEGDVWPLTLTVPNGEWAGALHWGYPDYAGRVVPGAQTLTVPLSADAPVGGNTDCGSDDYPAFFGTWGSRNEDAPTDSAARTVLGTAAQVNVAQAQWDVADWPCYSRYYAQWSLAGLPAGAQVVSATVTMRQFGNPGYGDAYAEDGSKDTLVQVWEVVQPWTEGGITWDSAPAPRENVARTLVQPIPATCPAAYCNPGIPYAFDVTEIVRRAQADDRNWASMALYTAAGQYHSGKFFWSREGGNQAPVVRIAYTLGGTPTWEPTPTATLPAATATSTSTPAATYPPPTASPTTTATSTPTASSSTPTPTPPANATCTRTVSPGGLTAAVAALRPGDVLCLADGTYTEAIAPRVNGTAAAPITIRALHDGAATIDGQGVRKPLNLGEGTGGGNWFVIDGLVLRNGTEHVAIVKGSNNVLRRVSLYDADTDVNSQPLLLWGTDNTVEDCLVGGTGRFMIDIFGGGNWGSAGGNTVRRCFVKWSGWDGKNFCGVTWPNSYMIGVYNSSNNTIENSIAYGRGVTGIIVQANSSGVTAANNQVLGSLSLLMGKGYNNTPWNYGTFPNRPGPTSNPYGGANCDESVTDWTWPGQRVGFQLFGQGILSNNVFRDNLAANNAGLGFSINNPGGGSYSGNVFDRFTLYGNGSDAPSGDGGRGAQVRLLSGMSAADLKNTCIWPKPAVWANGAGARLVYRYMDRQLTSDPLLPWPMESRAQAELGISITAIAQDYITRAEACN